MSDVQDSGIFIIIELSGYNEWVNTIWDIKTMNKLAGLPRMAHVTCHGNMGLKVDNHRVKNSGGLLDWLSWVAKHDFWHDILPQMISQGFHIGAVIEECLADLNNQHKFTNQIYWFGISNFRYDDRVKFASTEEGDCIRMEYIKKMKTCKNWDDLYSLIRPDGIFF